MNRELESTRSCIKFGPMYWTAFHHDFFNVKIHYLIDAKFFMSLGSQVISEYGKNMYIYDSSKPISYFLGYSSNIT